MRVRDENLPVKPVDLQLLFSCLSVEDLCKEFDIYPDISSFFDQFLNPEREGKTQHKISLQAWKFYSGAFDL
jgi:hypothetical protein